MLRDIAIAIHAGAASASFGLGVVVLITASRGKARTFVAYYLLLIVAVAAVSIAIALDWPGLGDGTRAVYVALALVGVFMIWRGEQARRLRHGRSVPDRAALAGHVGFTVAAFFDGFLILAAQPFGTPIVVLIGVVGGAVGLRAVAIAKPSEARIGRSNRTGSPG